MEIRITGLDELLSGIKQVSDQIQSLDLSEVGKLAARVAVSKAPRDKGKLAASIHPFSAPNIAGATSSSPYGHIQNYGSPARGIRALRFMNKADTVLENQAPDMIDKDIDRLLKKL